MRVGPADGAILGSDRPADEPFKQQQLLGIGCISLHQLKTLQRLDRLIRGLSVGVIV